MDTFLTNSPSLWKQGTQDLLDVTILLLLYRPWFLLNRVENKYMYVFFRDNATIVKWLWTGN